MAERANKQLAEVGNAFADIARVLEKAVGSSVNPDERRYFHSKIQSSIQKTTNAPRDLHIKLNHQKSDSCEELREGAAVKLKNVLLSSPPEEKILEKLNDGTINQHNAIDYFTDELRLKIIRE